MYKNLILDSGFNKHFFFFSCFLFFISLFFKLLFYYKSLVESFCLLIYFFLSVDDFNRVILSVKRGQEFTDYINASFIDVSAPSQPAV